MTKRRGRLRIDYRKSVSFARLTGLALLLTIATLIPLSLVASQPLAAGNVYNIYDSVDDYWKLVKRGGRVLVFVEQEGCLACRELKPYLLKFAETHGDNVTVVRLHIDKLLSSDPDAAMELISQLRLYATPTLILYVNGVEVARHVGLFDGDQLAGLEAMVFNSTSISAGGREATSAFTATPLGLAAVFAFGLAAAFSPCSAPLLAVYSISAQYVSGRRLPRIEVFKSNATLLATVGIGGIILALASSAVSTLAGVPLASALLAFAGWMVILWGAFELRGLSVLSRSLSKATRMLPLLGLECSLPFLLAALAIASKSVTAAAASALLFSAGFSLPYILAGTAFSTVLRPVASWLGSNVKARSSLLVVSGVLLLYYSVELALG